MKFSDFASDVVKVRQGLAIVGMEAESVSDPKPITVYTGKTRKKRFGLTTTETGVFCCNVYPDNGPFNSSPGHVLVTAGTRYATRTLTLLGRCGAKVLTEKDGGEWMLNGFRESICITASSFGEVTTYRLWPRREIPLKSVRHMYLQTGNYNCGPVEITEISEDEFEKKTKNHTFRPRPFGLTSDDVFVLIHVFLQNRLSFARSVVPAFDLFKEYGPEIEESVLISAIRKALETHNRDNYLPYWDGESQEQLNKMLNDRVVDLVSRYVIYQNENRTRSKPGEVADALIHTIESALHLHNAADHKRLQGEIVKRKWPDDYKRRQMS